MLVTIQTIQTLPNTANYWKFSTKSHHTNHWKNVNFVHKVYFCSFHSDCWDVSRFSAIILWARTMSQSVLNSNQNTVLFLCWAPLSSKGYNYNIFCCIFLNIEMKFVESLSNFKMQRNLHLKLVSNSCNRELLRAAE